MTAPLYIFAFYFFSYSSKITRGPWLAQPEGHNFGASEMQCEAREKNHMSNTNRISNVILLMRNEAGRSRSPKFSRSLCRDAY